MKATMSSSSIRGAFSTTTKSPASRMNPAPLRLQPAVVPLSKPKPARFVTRAETKSQEETIGLSFDSLGDLDLVENKEKDLGPSRARMVYSKSCEEAINDQINIEYNVSYIYHSLYAHFARDNVALPGLAAYFKDASNEEREHAEALMDYQVMRGGQVQLRSLLMPEMDIWDEEKGDALSAMEVTLSLEKLNNEKLLALHAVADEAADVQMMEFLEGNFLGDQVDSIKKVADMVTELRMVGKGMGTWKWDQELGEKLGA